MWADLGECGDKLSNGQQHSIAIIRALVRDPQVVILDETTGKVDAEVWHAVSKIHLGNCHLNPKTTALLHSIRNTLWCRTTVTYKQEFIEILQIRLQKSSNINLEHLKKIPNVAAIDVNLIYLGLRLWMGGTVVQW